MKKQLVLRKLEKGALTGQGHPNGANKDEVDQYVFGTPPINNRCKLHKLLQSDGLVLRKVTEQGGLRFSEGDLGEFFVLLVFPYL